MVGENGGRGGRSSASVAGGAGRGTAAPGEGLEMGSPHAQLPCAPTGHKHRLAKGLCQKVHSRLFIIAQTRKQSKHLITGEQMNKVWYGCALKYYSAIKGSRIQSTQQHEQTSEALH